MAQLAFPKKKQNKTNTKQNIHIHNMHSMTPQQQQVTADLDH